MSRNNPREADTRRAHTPNRAVSGSFTLHNTPRQKEDFMSLLLPRIPDGTPTDKQGDAVEEIKKQIREQANERLGDLFRSRKLNGAIESEADLVAGASAMLQIVNEITFSPEDGQELSLVPPAWFLCIFSGRGLSELYDDKEKDEILKAVSEETRPTFSPVGGIRGEEVQQ